MTTVPLTIPRPKGETDLAIEAAASPSMPRKSRPMRASMGYSCCADSRLTALQVVLRYRNLLAVEQGFLAAKTLLATRPIFHRTDAAIRGHIFGTFLALVAAQRTDGPAHSPPPHPAGVAAGR
jgi:transposase